MSKRPLQVGDRVRVRTGTGNFGSVVGKGKITGEVMGLGGNCRCFDVLIERKDGMPWHNYRAWENQCRRLVKRKPRTEERGRVRCRAEIVEGDRSWISAKFFARSGGQLFPRDTRPAGVELEGVFLAEMRPGERVISRQDLERAWKDGAPIGHHAPSLNSLCKALGLAAAGEGEKG